MEIWMLKKNEKLKFGTVYVISLVLLLTLFDKVFRENNIRIVAKVLKIDINLIRRIFVIIEVLSSDKEIDTELFKTYCNDTAELWVIMYPWKLMPPTVHKNLIHGSAIINELGGNIGRFSEEAQEANKIFREARNRKSRLISISANNEDIIKYLLVSSDPYLSTIRQTIKHPNQSKVKHFEAAEELLKKK